MASYPTEKMRSALLKFKVPLEQVNKMSFSDASFMLKELIDKAKAHDASSTAAKSQEAKGPGITRQAPTSLPLIKDAQQQAKEAVSLRLRAAIEIVDKEMPQAKDYADYYALVAECMRQLYGAAWLQKDMSK